MLNNVRKLKSTMIGQDKILYAYYLDIFKEDLSYTHLLLFQLGRSLGFNPQAAIFQLLSFCPWKWFVPDFPHFSDRFPYNTLFWKVVTWITKLS